MKQQDDYYANKGDIDPWGCAMLVIIVLVLIIVLNVIKQL